MVYHRVLNIVPCAIQQDLMVYLLHVLQLKPASPKWSHKHVVFIFIVKSSRGSTSVLFHGAVLCCRHCHIYIYIYYIYYIHYIYTLYILYIHFIYIIYIYIQYILYIYYMYNFYGHTHGIQKFPGHRLNPSHSCNLCHGCGNAGFFNPLH